MFLLESQENAEINNIAYKKTTEFEFAQAPFYFYIYYIKITEKKNLFGYLIMCFILVFSLCAQYQSIGVPAL